MNRNNDTNCILCKNAEATLREITQFCNDYPSESENFHQFGFDCLLKKLKELEKIILTISKAQIGVQGATYSNKYCPISQKKKVAVENESVSEEQATIHQVQNKNELNLPDHLTVHTKIVLNKIYERFEVGIDQFWYAIKIKCHEILNDSYCKFEFIANTLHEIQTKKIKHFVENILKSDLEAQTNTYSMNNQYATKKINDERPTELELLLPDTLNYLTKFMLNRIFNEFEKILTSFSNSAEIKVYETLYKSYGQFELEINVTREKMKSELRYFIENYLKPNYEELDDDVLPSSSNNFKKNDFKDTIKSRKKHNCNYCETNVENRHPQINKHYKLPNVPTSMLEKHQNKHSKNVEQNQNHENNVMSENTENLDDTKYLNLPTKFYPTRLKRRPC